MAYVSLPAAVTLVDAYNARPIHESTLTGAVRHPQAPSGSVADPESQAVRSVTTLTKETSASFAGPAGSASSSAVASAARPATYCRASVIAG